MPRAPEDEVVTISALVDMAVFRDPVGGQIVLVAETATDSLARDSNWILHVNPSTIRRGTLRSPMTLVVRRPNKKESQHG